MITIKISLVKVKEVVEKRHRMIAGFSLSLSAFQYCGVSNYKLQVTSDYLDLHSYITSACTSNPNLIVRLSESYYCSSVTLRVLPLSRERKELSETRWCQNDRIFKGFSVTCVGHTA